MYIAALAADINPNKINMLSRSFISI